MSRDCIYVCDVCHVRVLIGALNVMAFADKEKCRLEVSASKVNWKKFSMGFSRV